MDSTTLLATIETPGEVEQARIGSLYEAIQQVRDSRKPRGIRYEAAAVLVILLLAKMAGEKSMVGVAEWARLRGEWLRTVLPWGRSRFPCANTYTNVCDHIDGSQLSQVVGDFFQRMHQVVVEWEAEPTEAVVPETAAAATAVELDHLALDGKSLRGSRRTSPAPREAQQVVGLYQVTKQYMVAQRPIPGKGRERAAALQLLASRDLRGVLLSADALHTQPKWCRTVLAQGGHYLVIAKKNQATLREDIAALFGETPVWWLPEQNAHQTDKGHGRLEVRQIRVSSELADFLSPKWPGVQQVFRIDRRIRRHGQTTLETAYGMTSLSARQISPAHLLTTVRHHWHIENRSHWRRDVSLGEDNCHVTTGQVPQVLAALNNALLSLMDYLGVTNVARQIRVFAAAPADALGLLLNPL